jgi:hypothetical protein
MKTDKSIHNICIASIKRSTIKPYDFKWTKFYEVNTDFQYTELGINLAESELFICSTFIDKDNFSILTTRRLLTMRDGQLDSGNIQGATDNLYGDFKGYKTKDFTFGLVQLENGNELKYFIETGNASMIMIHGVRTLIGTTRMTNK